MLLDLAVHGVHVRAEQRRVRERLAAALRRAHVGPGQLLVGLRLL